MNFSKSAVPNFVTVFTTDQTYQSKTVIYYGCKIKKVRTITNVLFMITYYLINKL